ncbi:MAG: glycosyl hydrolase-related protein, partial [Acidimicrobiia bacterium]
GQALAVRGVQVSAVRREPGGLVVRVFNPSQASATAEVDRDGAPVTGWVVDLVGRPLERFEGSVALRPWRLATLRLD